MDGSVGWSYHCGRSDLLVGLFTVSGMSWQQYFEMGNSAYSVSNLPGVRTGVRDVILDAHEVWDIMEDNFEAQKRCPWVCLDGAWIQYIPRPVKSTL